MSDSSPCKLSDGCLLFDETGEVIRPAMDGDAFEQTKLVKNAGYRSGTYTAIVRLGLLHVCGQPFHTSFVFQKGHLRSVELCLHFDDPAKDEPWDYAIELERKAAHEKWASEQLGQPLKEMPGFEEWPTRNEVQHLLEYSWGAIKSIYDSKGGCSYLRVEYSGPPAPERAV